MAVAISTPGDLPSERQLAAINQLLLPEITKRGFSLAKDPVAADYVMRVRFTPDMANPPAGHLTFLGIERNQGRIGSPSENSAAEASAQTLAELRKVMSEMEWLNAATR